MNLLQIKRLEKLITSTAEAPKESFDMSRYAWESDTGTSQCGTPACLLGNYAARRDLQRLMKIKLHTEQYEVWATDEVGKGIIDSNGNFYKTTSTCTDVHLVLVSNDEDFDYYNSAVLEHFGININEALELFSVAGCGNAGTSRAKALRYVRKFVAAKKRQFARDRGFRSWKAYQASKEGK